jgi:hypothetical protein
MKHEPHAADAETTRPVDDKHLRSVRPGHGANCSSIGSVIDTLFATATIGAAVFAAAIAALRSEEITTVTPQKEPAPPKEPTREEEA